MTTFSFTVELSHCNVDIAEALYSPDFDMLVSSSQGEWEVDIDIESTSFVEAFKSIRTVLEDAGAAIATIKFDVDEYDALESEGERVAETILHGGTKSTNALPTNLTPSAEVIALHPSRKEAPSWVKKERRAHG